MSHSSEFNLNKEKCLSCQHYSGCHGVSEGLLGARIEYENTGVCVKRGEKHPEDTRSSNWCFKWVRDSRIALYLDKIEKQEAEQKAKIEREKEESRIREEHRKLEEERKRFEYEKWYASLTKEEQTIEDRRVNEEKKQEERKKEEQQIAREEQFKKLHESELIRERKAKKKKAIILISVLYSAALLIAGISVGVSISNNNNHTLRLLNYLEKNALGYKDNVMTQYIVMEDRGKVHFNMEYKKGYWTSSGLRKYDFRVTAVVPPKANSPYTGLQTSMCFNLKGTENKTKENSYSARFDFETNYSVIDFSDVNYDSALKDIVYKNSNVSRGTLLENEYMSKSDYETTAWAFLGASYTWINDYYYQATGQQMKP